MSFFYPDGRSVHMGGTPGIILPEAQVVATGGTRAVTADVSAEGFGRACGRLRPVSARVGSTVVVRLPWIASRAWVAHRRGATSRLQAARRLVWEVPARPASRRVVAFGVRDPAGATFFFRVCVRPVAPR